MPNNPINKKTSALLVNNAYSLPIVDGNANDRMITNGAGVASWSPIQSSVVIQTVYATNAARVACSTVLPADNTIPQKTEGDEVITVSITPTSSTNKLLIEFNTMAYTAGAAVATVALFQDATSNALAAVWIAYLAGIVGNGVLRYVMTAGTTSATTFKIRIGPHTAGTIEVNGAGGTRYYGGVASTWLTVTEYKV